LHWEAGAARCAYAQKRYDTTFHNIGNVQFPVVAENDAFRPHYGAGSARGVADGFAKLAGVV
jgi:hypothetical protein